MYPYLIDTEFFKLPSYAVFMWLGAIAFICVLVWIVEKREKTDRKTVNRILIITAIGAIALYAFAFFFNSLFHSLEEGELVLGGITWLGGVLGAFPLTVFLLHKFCPRIKGNALFYFNLLVPAIALGHAFGRVGCFFAGCCYGKPTDAFLGVQFPLLNEKVYPTQLFEAAFEFAFFGVCVAFYKKLREHFLEGYLFGYGVFRFLLEFMRGDDRGGLGIFLSPSQVICLLMLIAGVLLILYRKGMIFKTLYKKAAAWRAESEKYGVYLREDVAVALKKLKGLQQDGLLTSEEYESYKKQLEEKL